MSPVRSVTPGSLKVRRGVRESVPGDSRVTRSDGKDESTPERLGAERDD